MSRRVWGKTLTKCPICGESRSQIVANKPPMTDWRVAFNRHVKQHEVARDSERAAKKWYEEQVQAGKRGSKR